MFEFFFKYRPLVFEQGEFAFGAPDSVRLWLAVAGLLGIAAAATYTLARGKSGTVDRSVMAAGRVGLLGVLLFCLMQPMLVLSTVVPQQNFVGVLLDDSRSMQLTDEDGRLDSTARRFFGMTSGNGEFWSFGRRVGRIGMTVGREDIRY